MIFSSWFLGKLRISNSQDALIFWTITISSSCTVYGEPEKLPITEENETGKNVTNVYGRTKYFVEEMLRDLSFADDRWNIIALRYTIFFVLIHLF